MSGHHRQWPKAVDRLRVAPLYHRHQFAPPPVAAIQLIGSSAMKVRNSLKSLAGRHRANRIVRRRGRLYIINKVNPRFKARQG